MGSPPSPIQRGLGLVVGQICDGRLASMPGKLFDGRGGLDELRQLRRELIRIAKPIRPHSPHGPRALA